MTAQKPTKTEVETFDAAVGPPKRAGDMTGTETIGPARHLVVGSTVAHAHLPGEPGTEA